MKPLLIIKTGSAVASASGDFEEWIAAAAGFALADCLVRRVMDGESLPETETVSGVVITGSAAMISERLPWSEYSASWLREAADTGLPILGICFGHQLLAHALGGVVDYHPGGREIGTTMVSQTALAETDPLFQDLPDSFAVQVSHMQTVLQLPGGTRVLANNDFEAHQAVRYRDRVWGVQFHPEFSRSVIQSYLDERAAQLRAEGRDVAALNAGVSDSPDAARVLQNFGNLLRY